MKVKPILFGYSWVGLLNIILIQWFFVRVQAVMDKETRELLVLELVGPIVPMTGWSRPYGRPFGKRWICTIWRKRG